jgi:hypothetical protein
LDFGDERDNAKRAWGTVRVASPRLTGS